ncbi:hypothetical protein TTHERM_000616459 (macronuclear) [Tetrahymena thermophila SB210]|uniref:Uncharacterized protein n=1 Tax=Tetrahymena thermophila (strain SB210) TaxID=312017 RepID=W7X686_TETTS|nr:hypothetical protein TTHERM_000616459 [Tetrahymena thermophila SB210]EWS71843.1 hypothetical protein TTHERM_000616459 [Tetrahymena thermophila SB210]|eukprot:XP_012655636.1 hypothetical protein TTHERM_000616459 [Tetrahymena thermophila SB210]
MKIKAKNVKSQAQKDVNQLIVKIKRRVMMKFQIILHMQSKKKKKSKVKIVTMKKMNIKAKNKIKLVTQMRAMIKVRMKTLKKNVILNLKIKTKNVKIKAQKEVNKLVIKIKKVVMMMIFQNRLHMQSYKKTKSKAKMMTKNKVQTVTTKKLNIKVNKIKILTQMKAQIKAGMQMIIWMKVLMIVGKNKKVTMKALQTKEIGKSKRNKRNISAVKKMIIKIVFKDQAKLNQFQITIKIQQFRQCMSKIIIKLYLKILFLQILMN